MRGWDLPLFDVSHSLTSVGQEPTGCPFVHLTGWGDFPLRGASWIKHKTGGLKGHHADPKPNVWKATAGPDAGLTDDLSAVWDNMQLGDNNDDDISEVEPESDEEMLEEEEEEVQIGDIPSDSDEETANYLDAVENASTKATSVSFKPVIKIHKIPAKDILSAADRIKAAKVELEFPDEVRYILDANYYLLSRLIFICKYFVTGS